MNGVDFEKLPLIRAVRYDSVDRVREILEAGGGAGEAVDPTTRATVLFFAAQRRNDEEAVEITTLLVEKYKICDPKQKDRMNQTCLFYAARDGNNQLCEYLVKHGCDPNSRDNHLQTCLFYAAREGRTESLTRLIDLGADPNIADLNGQTAIFYAAREGKLQTVQALLDRGANAAIKDKQRRTAVTFARQGGHAEVVMLLKTSTPLSRSNSLVHGSQGSMGSIASFGVGVVSPESPNNCISPATAQVQQNLPANAEANLSEKAELFKEGLSAGTAAAVVLTGGSGVRGPELEGIDQQNIQSTAQIRRLATGIKSASSGYNFSEQENVVRKKYRLQYKWPSAEQNVWLDAPLVKVEEFERVFPYIAVWPKDKPVIHSGAAANPLKKEWNAAAMNLVQDLSKYEGGHIFEKLVDVRKNNCPDYYDIVKNPTSFSCIKAKLRKFEYETIEDFIADINLVFYNCRLYNKPNSWVSLVGAQLEKYFNNQMIVRHFDLYIKKQKEVNDELLKTAKENELYKQQCKQKNDLVDQSNSTKMEQEFQPRNLDLNRNKPQMLYVSETSVGENWQEQKAQQEQSVQVEGYTELAETEIHQKTEG